MEDGSETKKAEGKPRGKPTEKDVICLTSTRYAAEHFDAGSVIRNFDRKRKAYGKTAPASEAHKYKKYLFNGEWRMKLKTEGGKNE